MRLASTTALVTGASRGIGAATARLLARLGAAVGVHCRADGEAAARVVDTITKAGGRAEAIVADLSRWEAAEPLVARCEERLGPVGIVVLNHGIWKEASIDRMTREDYDETMDANLRGYFAVARAAAIRMKRAGKGGRILFVASTAGQRGEAHHAHYAATKGAIISLTKSLAPELAPDGILVNCVAPGWVATEMSEPALRDQATRDAVHAAIPLRRVGTPDEIAWPIAFLASEGATFMTGEIVNVNGGAVLCG
jgi:3-oxoacyl-[acyl-carrier protein] reductase